MAASRMSDWRRSEVGVSMGEVVAANWNRGDRRCQGKGRGSDSWTGCWRGCAMTGGGAGDGG